MMVGTENGIRRWNKDVTAQLRGGTSGQRQAIKEALRIMIPITPEERDMNLNDRMNCLRLRRAIKEFSPDLIVFDPYGDFFAGDNENDAVQTRRTVKTLMNISQSANPQTAVIVVHHARSGKTAAAGADGWDRGGYARGSKALMSIARAQINIAPGDKDGKSLVIACGKNNNGPKFEAFGVRLDPETMRYGYDPKFSMEEWSKEVGDKSNNESRHKVRDSILFLALKEKALSHGQLVKAVMDATDCSMSTAKRVIGEAVERGIIIKGEGYYCLPAAQGSRVQAHEPDTK